MCAFNWPCLFINLSFNLILSKCTKLGVFKHKPNKLQLNAELHLLEILSSISSINLITHACDIPLKSLKEHEFCYQPERYLNLLLFELNQSTGRFKRS